MTRTTIARLAMLTLLVAAFAAAGWQLLSSAPESKRERPPTPVPLIDVVPTEAGDRQLRLTTSGTVISAQELDIRPEVGGRIQALHVDFEPGGRIAAGETLVEIAQDEYRLAVSAAQADIAKAEATVALERGRRVVAREELDFLQGSVKVDAASQALALRKPQLRQVQAELAVAQNQLQRAELDLARTQIALPFDVVVLARERVANEVVAARELIGRVTRADQVWLEMRVQPGVLRHVRAHSAAGPGSRVVLPDGGPVGEVMRIRADLAEGSRLAGVIAAFSVTDDTREALLLGSYVRAAIEGGVLDEVITVPRRALRDNDRLWVVDRDGALQVRRARVAWESGQQLFLAPDGASDGLQPGDQVVVSRIDGLVPGTAVRQRLIDAATGRPLATTQAPPADG